MGGGGGGGWVGGIWLEPSKMAKDFTNINIKIHQVIIRSLKYQNFKRAPHFDQACGVLIVCWEPPPSELGKR